MKKNFLKRDMILLLVLALITQCTTMEEESFHWPDKIQVVLDNTTPLKYDRSNRLPLYLWPAIDPGDLTNEATEQLVREFNTRGVGVVSSWSSGNTEESVARSLTIARVQKKLGQRININATSLLNSYFNGDDRTAHIDENGKPFFDESFGNQQMGCPFAIDYRKKEIRDRVEFYVNEYREAGLPVDFIFADWEIDGPLEVNHSFEASKKCVRCRKYLGEDFSFAEFQKTMREMRSYLQNYSFSTPVLTQFPGALVGNYAVYPNDGYRYWYDYYEYYVDGRPYRAEQNAKYRKWYNDFPATGYTFAMPVVYPWSPVYSWYDFDNPDYRWFYNMLMVAGNAGKSTPQNIPVISFVHWNTIFVEDLPDTTIKQMSKESYQELLWHMILRGTDTFFMWCGTSEFPEEVRLVHQVYAAAQQYGGFLEHGLPVTYDLPDNPGTVISGLAFRDSVLIRRTDFSTNHEPVEILIGTQSVTIDYLPGVCRILALE